MEWARADGVVPGVAEKEVVGEVGDEFRDGTPRVRAATAAEGKAELDVGEAVVCGYAAGGGAATVIGAAVGIGKSYFCMKMMMPGKE